MRTTTMSSMFTINVSAAGPECSRQRIGTARFDYEVGAYVVKLERQAAANEQLVFLPIGRRRERVPHHGMNLYASRVYVRDGMVHERQTHLGSATVNEHQGFTIVLRRPTPRLEELFLGPDEP